MANDDGLPPLTPEEALEKARRFLADSNGAFFDDETSRRVMKGLIAAKTRERETLLAFFRRNIHTSHYMRLEKNIPPEL